MFRSVLTALLTVCWLSSGCGRVARDVRLLRARPLLQFMSTSWLANAEFDRQFLKQFGERNGVDVEYVPNYETVDSRLSMYKRLLKAHATHPELLQVDVVWPTVLADDLVDLRPYLKKAGESFSPAVLDIFTVKGRIVALPSYVDAGILYYRPELLKRYGLSHPPQTWDELELMAERIQNGERASGHGDFWGFVWQGASFEGLACDALEWQSSSGAGNYLQDGSVNVRDKRFVDALKRAARWIGTISPPGEYAYEEEDANNVFSVGQAAFMRGWVSSYGHVAQQAQQQGWQVAAAPLPEGPGGRAEVMGGAGIGVSRYAADRELAIKALLEMCDLEHERARLAMVSGIPTHLELAAVDPGQKDSLAGALRIAGRSLIARPALAAGDKYDLVSSEYAAAVNSVLRRQATPEAALAQLEAKLVRLTGLPAR